MSVDSLCLLVLVGLGSAYYAKGEGASPLLAALVGVAVALVVYFVAPKL